MMFRKYLVSDEGNIAVVFALAALPLLGAVAGAVDYVSASNKAAKLQDSLDSAALAIATKYYSGMSQQELEEIGLNHFQANVKVAYTSPGEFEFFDNFSAKATTEGHEDYIVVTSSIAHEGIIGSMVWRAERKSVVKIEPGAPACVLALDPDASSAIKIQGSAEIAMKGCRLVANSDADDAISRNGAAQLLAECVYTVGGTSGVVSDSRVQLDCPHPLENQYPADDPLAGLQLPDETGCMSVPAEKTKTLFPGTYCNETFSGEITLEPGVYILAGGEVKLGGNGSLTGQGVTLFLMDDAGLTINANQTVRLSPPDEGDYAGITIYQEHGNTSPIKINGTADSEIDGFIYAPSAHIFHAGNSTMTTENCLRIVGNTVELTGNSGLSLDCREMLGGRSMHAGRYMVIVE